MDSEKDSSTTHSGINTKNISIADDAAQQALTGKSAEQTKSDILTTVTTDTAREHSGALSNNFDKDQVQSEINLQVDVTQRFDQNRQGAKAEINKKIDDAKKQYADVLAKEKNGALLSQQEQEQLTAYYKEADQYQKLGIVLDTISAGLSAPTSSALGIAGATLSPIQV